MNDLLQGKQGWVLKRSSKEKVFTEAVTKTGKKLGCKKEQALLCGNCGHTITTPKSIISVGGTHRHTFTNPLGFSFEIGCFSSAQGCIACGNPTLEHTWFEGFSWNFSICSKCFIHLGWYYQRLDEHFFGLILSRLVDTAKIH